jgi:hypothetical protein
MTSEEIDDEEMSLPMSCDERIEVLGKRGWRGVSQLIATLVLLVYLGWCCVWGVVHSVFLAIHLAHWVTQ